MSKIENSVHIDFINESILNNQFSLRELVFELRKRGFSISIGSLATYAKELKAAYGTEIQNDISSEIDKITGESEVNYKKEYSLQKRIIFEMYKNLVKRAYSIIMQNKKVVPLSLLKSIKELQMILKNQDELK